MENTKAVKKHAGHAFSQFKLTNCLLQNLYKFKLTPTAKLVLLELSACFNPNKPDMFPKQKTLAAKIGISEASVIRGIQELHKEGLIISERKYTRRYKFTSKIGCILPDNEKFFTSNKLQEENTKKESLKDCNLQPHEHEPIKEQKKEPEKVEDFKILKNYAEKKGAKNITAYINALKKNGSADRIIKEIRDKEAVDRFYKRQVEETKKRNAEYAVWIADNPKDCAKLNEVLKTIRCM